MQNLENGLVARSDTKAFNKHLRERKKVNEQISVPIGTETVYIEEDNINLFREEIKDLEVCKPRIVSFGNDTYKILSRSLSTEYDIVEIPHYSHYISKENFKKQVDAVLKLTQ